MNKLNFAKSHNAGYTKIKAHLNGVEVGFIISEYVENGYEMFDSEMSEETYKTLFPDDKFSTIETIKIHDKFKGNGYARPLMNIMLEYLKDKGEGIVYLNASPMGPKGLDLSDLVNFYESFGFKVIPQIDKWDENKEMILELH